MTRDTTPSRKGKDRKVLHGSASSPTRIFRCLPSAGEFRTSAGSLERSALRRQEGLRLRTGGDPLPSVSRSGAAQHTKSQHSAQSLAGIQTPPSKRTDRSNTNDCFFSHIQGPGRIGRGISQTTSWALRDGSDSGEGSGGTESA